jgi:hypothetical protein
MDDSHAAQDSLSQKSEIGALHLVEMWDYVNLTHCSMRERLKGANPTERAKGAIARAASTAIAWDGQSPLTR